MMAEHGEWFGGLPRDPRGNINEPRQRARLQPKGAFTVPPLAYKFSDQGWWTETMRGQVAAVIMSDVLRAVPLVRHEVSSSDEYWNAIKLAASDVRTTGHTPVLIVSGRAEPDWIADWRYEFGDRRRPEDMRLWQQEHQPEGYEFNINDIEVYLAAVGVGRSIVIAREVFDTVTFRQANGRFVEIEFEDDPNDAWRGTMAARYQKQVIASPIAGHEISFGRSEA
jgi:hypothetical protein